MKLSEMLKPNLWPQVYSMPILKSAAITEAVDYSAAADAPRFIECTGAGSISVKFANDSGAVTFTKTAGQTIVGPIKEVTAVGSGTWIGLF